MNETDFIIWDLDGTKYRYHDDASAITKASLARVIQRLMVERGESPSPTESLVAAAEESYRKHGLSWLEFVGKWGIDRETLYREFNEALPLETIDGEPCPIFKSQLLRLKPLGIKQVIFTHGSRTWARRALSKINISEIFSDDMIFDCTHVDWNLKSEGAEAYRRLQTLINFSPSRSIMVEDSPQCLVGAKEAGLRTVLINRKGLDVSGANYIDHIYDTPQDFLSTLIGGRSVPEIQPKEVGRL